MSEKNQHQFLIIPEWLICVQPSLDVLTQHAVVIEGNKIAAIKPLQDINIDDYSQIYRLPHQALLPGFINAHTHSAMSLMRGVADDLSLMDWLQHHIWPIESKHVDSQFVTQGTELAVAEMIRGGTTCMNDMYFFPDITAKVCQRMGMRASIGLIVLDFPTVWASSADEYLSKGLETNDLFKELDLIQATLAPHAPYTVSDAPLEKIAMYSNELDLRVHMHVHETEFEVAEALKNTGLRPLERLDQLNLVNSNLIAVHMTQLTDSEIDRLAETGAHIAHCPESNLKLASGFCPTGKIEKAGVNISIGTDGAASNNDLDLLSEAKTAALLAKAYAQDATALNAQNALKMLTINAAKALGLEDDIGSIEVGKKADLISINLAELNTCPVYDPIAQIVYAANSRQVSHVWIDGKIKLKDGVLSNMDIEAIQKNAYDWRNKITA